VGFREDLKAGLDQHAEPAQTAHHQLGQVKTGGVFDHLAAPTHQPPLPIDKADTDQKVTHAAVAIAPRAAQPGGNRPTERGAMIHQRRIKGQILSILGQRCLHID
jgi:hypothetical protein